MAGSVVTTAQSGLHGFPAILTSFIGRVGPLREVTALLEQSRLVTVTGSGGAGKTRLADQVARRVADRFADGAWLVELAQVQDPAHVVTAVAAALEVKEQPGVPTDQALAQELARQQVLLVIDNCEHVIDAVARLCAELLAACDDVRVLATSREPLAVTGECRYRLAPLSLPGEDGAAGSEAVALFTDRAQRADARFTLDLESGPLIGRLVARLDGIPLAIELAAARVEALRVQQLLDRLDDQFVLLSSPDRLDTGRHRSLAATVEWSYQLLDHLQQRTFRRLSVFPGAFTLEAAEAVAGTGTASAVLHLVNCSLLSPPQAGPDGRARYQMLEMLRAYGTQLLAEAGEHEDAADALARYAVDLAEKAATALQSNTQEEAAAARWLDAEDAAMQQVLTQSLDRDPATAARLAAALGPWWRLRGRLAAWYPMLREITARAETGSDAWCAAQLWLAAATSFRSEHAAMLEHSSALADAAAGGGPSRALAEGLAGRAIALVNMGRTAEAIEEGHRALAAARESRYPAGEILALGVLAVAARGSDDLVRAVQLARRAAQITDGVPGAYVRWSGYVLTSTLVMAGELTAADEFCTAALAQCRDVGDVACQRLLLPWTAILDLHAGRLQDAAAHLREGLQISLLTGARYDLLHCLDAGGHLCAETGRPADAVTMWTAFGALLGHGGGGDHAPALARHRAEPLRAARRAIGPDRTRAAEDRGAAMDPAAAAEYALMLTSPDTERELARLSTRERELVTLVARGSTDNQIAAKLYISVSTVRTHLDRIRDKTGCRRRADLTRLAIQGGLA